MYTLETLKEYNQHVNPETISENDVKMVNMTIQKLKDTRTRVYPVPGDYLEYTCRHGVWYPDVHIDSVHGNEAEVCISGGGKVWFNSLDFPKGGGPWDTLPADQFAYIGKRIRFFDLILPGLLGTRSLRFEVEVNVWEYKAPNPYYEGYTTKMWNKMHIYHVVDEHGYPKDSSGYRYFGNGCAWKTDKDYMAWKQTYKAVVFESGDKNAEIVFYYREQLHVISKEEYHALDLPVDTRCENGNIVMVKFSYDDENHIIHTYSYAGKVGDGAISGSTHMELILDWRKYRTYEQALHGENWMIEKSK